jgi:hypothetical protein
VKIQSRGSWAALAALFAACAVNPAYARGGGGGGGHGGGGHSTFFWFTSSVTHPAPTAAVCPATPLPFNANAGISLPDGWEPSQQNCQLRAKGYFFYAKNRTIGAGLMMADVKRAGITDVALFAKSRRSNQVSKLTEAQESEIEQLRINDRPAWRFEVHGIGRTSHRDVTCQTTLIDAGTEIVMLSAEIPTDMYDADQKDLIGQLAYDVKGLIDTPEAAEQ